MNTPTLIPMPRTLKLIGGVLKCAPRNKGIALAAGHVDALMPAARTVQSAASEALKASWSIFVSSNPDNELVRISIEPEFREQYTLDIRPDDIVISATSGAMAFYAAQALAQLLRQFPISLPCLHIEDWPDFPARGVMLDISRDKVPTMQTLFALVDLFASVRINQLQLYTEHTFAYRAHPEVWAEASPMTGEQILELDRYCRERFIELVPNQNSFGHMERWLKLPHYTPLAEAPDGFEFPWGLKHDGGFTLDPTNAKSLELVESLFDELLPHFSSGLFNVGCDETFDLGLGRSKGEVEKRGKERVYLEFLLKIHSAVKSRGRQMMFWGDIILHKPELIPELPKDAIALNWGYDIGHAFETQTRAFQQAGVPFYVCPGTSSWQTIAGRTDNALGNLRDAAEQGLKHGAIGYLNTDWGDVGHLQYLPISFLPIAAGAAYSWCLESNRDLPLADAVSLHVFRDPSGSAGRLMFDFGNVYQAVKSKQFNSAAMFWSLVGGDERKRQFEGITRDEIEETESQLREIDERLQRVRMERLDATLIRHEVSNAIEMLRHACARARWRINPANLDVKTMASHLRQIIAEHERLWLARNRPGGMRDSVRRLENRLADYGVRRAGSAFG
jgi:hexosaminidase